MMKMSLLLKKSMLAVLLLGMGLAVLPVVNACAAPALTDDGRPPASERVTPGHVKQAWGKLQELYTAQGARLEKADRLIAGVQAIIERAEAQGLDTTALQDALDAFTAALPNAKAAHEPGAAIIARHAGFDDKGNIEDLETAIQTVRSLAEVIRNTRAAMDGTLQALREAVRTFLEANLPARTDAFSS